MWQIPKAEFLEKYVAGWSKTNILYKIWILQETRWNVVTIPLAIYTTMKKRIFSVRDIKTVVAALLYFIEM